MLSKLFGNTPRKTSRGATWNQRQSQRAPHQHLALPYRRRPVPVGHPTSRIFSRQINPIAQQVGRNKSLRLPPLKWNVRSVKPERMPFTTREAALSDFQFSSLTRRGRLLEIKLQTTYHDSIPSHSLVCYSPRFCLWCFNIL